MVAFASSIESNQWTFKHSSRSEQILGRLALRGEPVQNRHHMLATEALTDFDGQCFAAENIDHRQRSKARPIRELVGYEVEAPDIAFEALGRIRSRRATTILRRFGSFERSCSRSSQ